MRAHLQFTAVLAALTLASGCTSSSMSTYRQSASVFPLSTDHKTLPYFIEYPTGQVYPFGIVLGPDGAMWYTEANGSNLGRIDVHGTITEFKVGDKGEYGLAAGPDGDLWFSTDQYSNEIKRLTVGGVLTTFHVPEPIFSVGLLGGGLYDRVWFSNHGGPNNYLSAVGPFGKVTNYSLPTDCALPWGFSLGSAGTEWVTGLNCLMKVTPTGQITSYAGDPSHLLYLLVDGRHGYLWVTAASQTQPDAIDQISYSGHITQHKLAETNSGLYGIAQDGDNIYFSESTLNHIGVLNKSTYAVNEYEVPTPGSQPSNLAVGPDGNIWFTELAGNKIGVLVIH
jgi:streptogramin lyase